MGPDTATLQTHVAQFWFRSQSQTQPPYGTSLPSSIVPGRSNRDIPPSAPLFRYFTLQ